MIDIKKKIANEGTLIFTFFFLLIIMYIYPTIIKESVRVSLINCYNILIPSIFPYITVTRILSEYLIRFVLSSSNTTIKNRTTINAIAILTGLISGFPNGAIIASRFYNLKIISKGDAEKIVILSNCISPSFCIVYFGKYIINNTLIGLLIFASIVFSNIIVSVFLNNNLKQAINVEGNDLQYLSIPQLIADSCHIMLEICAFVTFYTCAANILLKILSLNFQLSKSIVTIFTSLLEISSGIINLSSLNFSKQVLFGIIFLSFTGICAVSQVIMICNKSGIPYKKYIISKILCALLSPIVFVLFIKIIPDIYLVSFFAIKNSKLIPKFVCLITISSIVILLLNIKKLKNHVKKH